MTDWLVTLPKTINWTAWSSEINHARTVGAYAHFRIPGTYKNGPIGGDRCFIVYDGAIRGWMPIVGVSHFQHGFVCSATGIPWSPGYYLTRLPQFNAIKGWHPMKGFRGLRKMKELNIGTVVEWCTGERENDYERNS